ncbi:hypothetical protein V5G93_24150, partial [Escherichia albertii]|uniref:hypothetical protein n=1 Tax=Escherichia albertii TaxID=208962 RepID=UPI00378D4F76
EIKKEDIVFIPETATYLINRIPCTNIAIWWLSIDFYYGYPIDKKISPQMLKHYVDVLKGGKLSFRKMKSFQHFHQSHYAKVFLSRKGIISKELSDYLNDEFIKTNALSRNDNRKKIIAYNPKKGIKTTNRLIRAFPDYVFVPLINMKPNEIKDLLKSIMIYIDFGHHPGKDRFPREAAISGCCIITGQRGSAKNNVDLPIPERFKLIDNSDDLEVKFGELVESIFNDFEKETMSFEDYRAKIRHEHQIFKCNVYDIAESCMRTEDI